MSSAPVAGAAFERYQRGGGAGAAATGGGNTVRRVSRVVWFLACVGGGLGVGGWGFGAVLVSDADGHLRRFVYWWVAGSLLMEFACL